MARGEVRAATWTSPRGMKVSMHTNGVAIQVLTNKSKAAKKLNKVSKKLRQEVLNVQNQMMQQMVPTTYLLRTRLRTLLMPMEG